MRLNECVEIGRRETVGVATLGKHVVRDPIKKTCEILQGS